VDPRAAADGGRTLRRQPPAARRTSRPRPLDGRSSGDGCAARTGRVAGNA
jgi:hypothetical protein